MKALVLSTAYPDPVRPTHGVFVHERVRAVARGAELTVLAPTPWHRRLRGGVPRQETRDGVAVRHPWFWYVPRFLKVLDGLGLFLSVLPAAWRARRREGFELIDAHFAWPEGFAAILLGKVLRRPVVITLRGTLEWLADDRTRGPLMGWAVRRATRLVAVSQPLAERAIALGADPARVTVVPNGVDTERFPVRERAAARAELGLPADGPLLVSVGHLSPRKGFQSVIAVLPGLQATHPGARLVVVGGPGAEGDNGAELRALAERLGVADRVHFAGGQPPEAVGRYLAAGDLFVLASRYEGCPNVVMEALACARPVVVSRVGETERMVPPHCGHVYGEATDEAALLAALRATLDAEWDAAAIRAHAEGRTWDRVAEQVLEVWRAALSDPDAGAPIPAHHAGSGPDAPADAAAADAARPSPTERRGPDAPDPIRTDATSPALPR